MQCIGTCCAPCTGLLVQSCTCRPVQGASMVKHRELVMCLIHTVLLNIIMELQGDFIYRGHTSVEFLHILYDE